MHGKAIWKLEISEIVKTFSSIAPGLHKRDLQRHIWAPGCKDQRPDAHPSWKTEVSKSAWIKPCTGNAVEWACIIAEILPPPPKKKQTNFPAAKFAS